MTNSTVFTTLQVSHFHAYKKVQKRGHFNMLDPRARQATGLSKEDYVFVINNYKGIAAQIEEDAHIEQQAEFYAPSNG